MNQIKKDFKIIFFNGGFAGDLITALYNPDVFKGFDGNTILLIDEVLKPKQLYFKKWSHDKKIEYLDSIKDLRVCSSHDLELAIQLKENTTLIYCSDYKLAKFFHSRLKRDNENMKLSLDELMNWQRNSRQVCKNQIDLINLNKQSFLEDLQINDSRSSDILKQWLERNKIEEYETD
jgi:hypothetical protein